MKLCWHKWMKQHETPTLTTSWEVIRTVGAVSLISGALFALGNADPSGSVFWCRAGLTAGLIGGVLLVVGIVYDDFQAVVLRTLCDKVCIKCGEAKLDYTNKEVAEKRARERLQLYTKTLRDANDE